MSTMTPEQWAADFIKRTGTTYVMGVHVDELAAVKRAADAMPKWREEALAVGAVYVAYLEDQPVLELESVCNEKTRARIAAGLT